ncbi:type III pantothenate kinase [Mucilaginibacter sp. RS28]|uniref:Type III pantothenate kinase n=1 Tax=Mucilaginibacter straminoryzae TaxID=2932774 RepID=A0A9X2B9T4_9SPHI|nr:type III pantothenate kinase [Mucilaginibacter straminoryzae]MCJ8210736.1 type III pantothenate kinase [Mucilaginibacter straminoryzae]
MPDLVVDIGNSQAKLAIFQHREILWTAHLPEPDPAVLSDVLSRYQPESAIISTVKKDHTWHEQLSAYLPVQVFNYRMAANIKNHYRTPETLGLDRLAAVVGAYAEYPEQASLVIDAGTCITYDFVDNQGNYNGGSISPGLQMRFRAMHEFTAALPLVSTDSEKISTAWGDDTPSAMQSGVQNGLKYEVTGFVESYREQHPELNVILTGGDAIFLDTVLKNSIFAPYIKIDPYLVLRGLNAVIQHND